MPTIFEQVSNAFAEKLGAKASLFVKAPGRVNLIGEHTDYNEGFVLPAAIDRAIYFAMAPSKGKKFQWTALEMGQSFESSVDSLSSSKLHWPDYLQGVLSELKAMGIDVPPVDTTFGGDIPIGSGLSASAALTTGFAFGLNELFKLGLDRVALAKLGQLAENNFVGMKCGIMDQFASLLGRANSLIQLDCRSLTYTYVPFGLSIGRRGASLGRNLSYTHVPFGRSDVLIALCDSHVKHSLAGSEYNVRRSQCEAGVDALKKHYPQINSLRDVNNDMLAAHKQEMDEVVFRRCSYVVSENNRVIEACELLSKNDLAAFGRAMNGSHNGLRDDYEVSCAELDILQSAALEIPGVLGSRMMGGGFGGCTINLVQEPAIEPFQSAMLEIYRKKLGKEPKIHVCQLGPGTEVIEGR